MKIKKWYKLDNVATFYSFTSSNVPTIFRYSVTLKDEIEKDALQQAVNETIEEFPSFKCCLKKGFFWYYLEQSDKNITVEEENSNICEKMYKDGDDLLIKINYFKKRINLEISHILSDGRGCLTFFKYLIYNYLKIKYQISNIAFEDISSSNEKSEDSFEKYYTGPKKAKTQKKKIYIYHGRKKKKPTYLEYHVSAEKVHQLAKTYQVTVTALLTAILISAYQSKMKELDKNKTIKIDVPVDLRAYFQSSTSRNFFGLISIICENNQNIDFEELVKNVNNQLKENTTKEQLIIRMNQMIALEKNIIVRTVPVIIKDIALKIADNIINKKSTSTISNIGKITVDKKLEPYIENFNVLTTPKQLQLTICSYKDDLSIGISSKYINNDIIKKICHFLTEKDIEGIININEEEYDEKV